jgi:acyl-coenzyme A thioesterase PaaI-like protein
VSDPASLESPVDDGHCFACGKNSAIGMKMKFSELPDGSVESRLTLAQPYQGWRGLAHGGIVAMLLDEAMAYAAGARGYKGMTAELKLRFRKPVPIGEPIVVRGAVRWERRNVLNIEAHIESEAGVELAGGEGSFIAKARLEPGRRLGDIDGGA